MEDHNNKEILHEKKTEGQKSRLLKHSIPTEIHDSIEANTTNQNPTVNNDLSKISAPPEILKHYKLLKQIGAGGMGKVYLALDTKLKRNVALKILTVYEESDEEIKRFMVEAQSLAKLQHPNIASVYDFGYDKELYFIVMEYIDGQPLDKVLDTMDLSEVPGFIATVAHAVHYAHTEGIIHRDIKPANILVDNDLKPCIVDFGLAKMQGYSVTQPGSILGTPRYMSPEQAQGKHNRIDERTDVYAIGTVLYHCIAKQPLFLGNNPMEIIIQVIEKQPPLPTKVNPKIAKNLEAICLKAINKKRSFRYKSALDFAEALEKFADNKYSGESHLYRYIAVFFLICIGVWGGYKYFFTGNLQGKQIDLEKTSQKYSQSEQHYLYAKKLAKEGFYNRAYEQLQLALEAQPGTADLQVNINKLSFYVLVELKEHKKAIAIYSQEQFKPTADISLALGKIYYYKKRTKEAKKHLDDLLSLTNISLQQRLDGYYYRALLAYEQKQYQQAIENFREVYNRSDKNQSLYFTSLLYLGKCYVASGQFAKAISFLQQARKKFPNLPQVHENLGVAYLEQQKTRINLNAARQFFGKCIELQPRNDEYHLLYGKVLEYLGDYHTANEYFMRALELNRESSQAIHGLVRLGIKDVGILFDRSAMFMEYMLSYHLSFPSIFAKDFESILYHYRDDYHKFLYVSQNQSGNPQSLIEKMIANPTNTNKISIDLMSLRYHPDLESTIKKTLKSDIAKKMQEQIRQIWNSIKKHKLLEQKFALYYHITHLYLKRDPLSREQLNKQSNQALLKQILKDPNENTRHRYLAAKALLFTKNFEILAVEAKSKDLILAVICSAVLRSVNVACSEVSLRHFVGTEGNDFIKSLAAFNMSKASSDYIFKLFSDKNDRVRLIAAGRYAEMYDILQEQTPKITQAREILLKFMNHRDHILRTYAHHYFWRACIKTQRDKIPPYVEKMKKGLQDSNPNVKRAILNHAVEFFPFHCVPELRKLALNKDKFVQARALQILAKCDPDDPYLNERMYDDNLYSFSRVFALGNVVIMRMLNPKKLMQELGNPYIIKNLPKLSRSKDAVFRATSFMLTARMGYKPFEYVSRESDLDVRAVILMVSNARSWIPIKQGNNLQKRALKLATEYISHPNSNLRKAAITTMLVFSYRNGRRKIYETLKNTQDAAIREGAAIGYYRLVRNSVEEINLSEMLRLFMSGKPYEFYLVKLLQRARTHHKKYLEWLNKAIELYPQADYHYERGLLYKVTGKLTLAQIDFERALKLKPDSSLYYADWLEVMAQQNKLTRKVDIPKKIIENTNNNVLLSKIGDLFLYWQDSEKAKDVFKLAIIKGFASKEVYIGLARSYSQLKEYDNAVMYLQYLKNSNWFNRRELETYRELEFPIRQMK